MQGGPYVLYNHKKTRFACECIRVCFIDSSTISSSKSRCCLSGVVVGGGNDVNMFYKSFQVTYKRFELLLCHKLILLMHKKFV